MAQTKNMTKITQNILYHPGNTMLVSASFMEGKTTIKDLCQSWIISWFANFLGALLLVSLAFKSATIGTDSLLSLSSITQEKCCNSFQIAFVRGLLCNWLNCMAVYVSLGYDTMIDKIIAIWLPVSAFVALGLDNSITNMFMIPMSIICGVANISVQEFLYKNLFPVTLGNIFGGVIAILPFGTSFGNWSFKRK